MRRQDHEVNDDELKEGASKLLQKLGNCDKCDEVIRMWKEQFVEAISIPKDEEDPDPNAKPPKIAVAMHIFVVFWKVLFATVPPVRLGGGWPAFCVSLSYIAGMTIGVSNLCGLLGCVIGCPPAITAITFVALGTSMPDLFASKQKAAAESDENADKTRSATSQARTVSTSTSAWVCHGPSVPSTGPWCLTQRWSSGRPSTRCPT